MKFCYLISLGFVIVFATFGYTEFNKFIAASESQSPPEVWSNKKTKIRSGKDAYMKPDGFIKYFNSITKSLDQTKSD